MAKPKAKTLQQRFGFIDADLKTPEHDEIMLWLDQNVEKIVKDLVFEEWDQKHIEVLKEKATDNVNRQIESLRQDQEESQREKEETLEESKQASQGSSLNVPKWTKWQEDHLLRTTELLLKFQSWEGLGDTPSREFKILKVDWESPITTGHDNKYIVGFADMKVMYNLSILHVSNIEKGDYYGSTSKSKDLPEWEVWDSKRAIFFEVKSAIKSLGELIRQIRMYEEYVGPNRFYVVCPDDKFKETLLSQGIGFVKYDVV